MGFAFNLLKTNHIGIRELKGRLSRKFLHDPLVITDRGRPISVNLPYEDVLELADLFDEINDPQTLKTVYEARQAVEKNQGGIPVTELFGRLRAQHR